MQIAEGSLCVGKQLILVEEGKPHFLLWTCGKVVHACWDLIEKSIPEFDFAFFGYRDIPCPSWRMQEICTLKMEMNSYKKGQI